SHTFSSSLPPRPRVLHSFPTRRSSDLAENLTDRQLTRLERAIAADERHDEVHVAWQCAQELRLAYRAVNPSDGRRIAEKLITSRSEEHTSELQSRENLVCRLLLEKKKL